MKYKNNTTFAHGTEQKIGVLITNLGTPDAPEKKALRKYLKEFLSDPRVVEPPPARWIWWLILNGVILNIRPAKSAESYKEVWDHLGEGTGSPLLAIALQQKKLIQTHLNHIYGDHIEVELAMRYGNPSIQSGLQKLKQKNVNRLIVLPLYPQYSASTTASTFDAVSRELSTWRLIPELRFVNHYHNNPGYIDALAESVKAHWQKHGQPNKLLMSYHGVPKRYLLNGDPYHCECYVTSRLLAEKLKLNESEYMVTFQSIFGREEWLQPYTADTLKSLPATGVEHVQIICPGFSADCLETIEEIEQENRGYFENAGGQTFSYIPALNATDKHIKVLAEVIENHMSGWSIQAPDPEHNKRSKEKALRLGAKQ